MVSDLRERVDWLEQTLRARAASMGLELGPVAPFPAVTIRVVQEARREADNLRRARRKMLS